MSMDQTLSGWLQAVGERRATPGGGGVAAHLGANAAALMAMVVRYSRGPVFSAAFATALDHHAKQFLRLAEADAAGYLACQRQLKTAKDNPALRDDAYLQAAFAPILIFELAGLLGRQLLTCYSKTNQHLRSDTQMVALILQCTLASARLNIDINLDACKQDALKQPLYARIAAQGDTQSALGELIQTFSSS